MLEKVFGFFVKKRNNYYDLQKKNIIKCSVPVISIGNLSTGGTGKTPIVIFICKKLLALGKKPAVIGRGYKKKSKNTVIISDGNEILLDSQAAGDEMLLLAQKLNVPVVASNKKYQAALAAESLFDIDCIVIDDGFQHRQLHRNYNIVLIDNKTLRRPYLLPKGRLREPFEVLKRADLICLTKNASAEDFKKIYPHSIPIVKSKFIFGNPYELFNNNNSNNTSSSNSNNNNNNRNNSSNTYINNLKFIAVAGIANPENFTDMLVADNFSIISSMFFIDHYNYNKASINKIASLASANNCNNIATTEKDAVKLVDFESEIKKLGLNIFVFPIETVIEDFNLPNLW